MSSGWTSWLELSRAGLWFEFFLLVFLDLFFFLLALILLTSLDRFIRCRWFDCKPRGWMEEHWIPFDIFITFLHSYPFAPWFSKRVGERRRFLSFSPTFFFFFFSSSGDRLSEPWTLRDISTLFVFFVEVDDLNEHTLSYLPTFMIYPFSLTSLICHATSLSSFC